MKDLLITGPCCYSNAEPARLLLESAVRQGLEISLYGIGRPFIAHGADAQVVQLREFLEPLRQEYRTVFVTDVADVLILAKKEEILDKFADYHSPLVMSAEREHWPDEGIAGDFPEDPNGYRWPNAGQYIGRMEDVVQSLDWLLNKYRSYHPGMDNSQPWWSWAYVRNELEFVLDRECRLFQTMSGGADGHVVIEGDRLLNTMTGNYPCSVHFNGPGNEKPYADMAERLYGKG
jgi:hypothetical protein